MHRAARLTLAVLGLLLLIGVAHATDQKTKAEICPWCKNDPDKMKKAGIISHGPIPIGPKGSEWIESALPAGAWIFLETAHLRWASSMGPMVVELEDKKRVLAELDRLRQVLPGVPEDVKKLDPWLRLHLMAMKGEELFTRFEKLLAVKDEDFPEARTATGPYMGNGKFLGEKDKFEVVVHSTRSTHNLFTKEFTGAQVTDSLRWHFPDKHKMLASVPAEDPDLKKDKWLWPHVTHNLSHLFFCAYKHFSFDPPLWLDEGLALCMEKEAEPQSTTNEGEEGGKRDVRGPKDWFVAAKKMVAASKQKRLGELMQIKEVGNLDEDAKITCWSMVRFLLDVHEAPFAKLLGGVKGQLDDKGYPSSNDLPSLQRKLLKEFWEWTPPAFDEAWVSWVSRP